MAAAHALAASLGHVLRHPGAIPTAAMEAGAWLAAGAPLAGEEDRAARRAICGVCPQWLPTEPGSPLMHCAACKCLAAKLAMATTRCPLGKWGPVKPSELSLIHI
jgi:hypothetical protein